MPGMPDATVAARNVRPVPSLNRRLHRLARGEHSVITAEEMAGIGLTPGAISRGAARASEIADVPGADRKDRRS